MVRWKMVTINLGEYLKVIFQETHCPITKHQHKSKNIQWCRVFTFTIGQSHSRFDCITRKSNMSTLSWKKCVTRCNFSTTASMCWHLFLTLWSFDRELCSCMSRHWPWVWFLVQFGTVKQTRWYIQNTLWYIQNTQAWCYV